MIEELIPIVLFVVTLLIVFVIVYYRYRARRELHLTVRDALDKGVELPESLLARLGDQHGARERDLRRAVLWLAVAVGMIAFALILGVPEATRPLLGVGAIPLLFGLAYLGLWRFGHSAADARDGEASLV